MANTITHDGENLSQPGARPRWSALWRDAIDPLAQHPWLGLAMGLALVAGLVPLLGIWHGVKGPLGPSIPLFFLVPVLIASTVGGRRAGVVVSVVAIGVWDWYFINPLYTVTIASVRDILALVVFLAVALLTGQLANAARLRTEEALRRAHSSEALYDLSMALIARREQADVLPTLAQRLRQTFDLEACAVLLPAAGRTTWRTAAVAGTLPPELRVEDSPKVVAVVNWVAAHGQASGLGAHGQASGLGAHGQASGLGQLHGDGQSHKQGRVVRPHGAKTRAQFLPLRVGARPMGVLELVNRAGVSSDPERERLLATFANGAAIALEQERLSLEERAAAVARESDRLKSALLSSVSHDLRTPLAGIKAAASSLLQEDVQWGDEDRRAFAADIDAEADRLTRLVSNLLDLSRIEAGAIVPRREWEDVGELVERVVRRLESSLGRHPITRDLPSSLPAVRLDAVQIEQVLTNLLENAAKYSPEYAPITISARLLDPPRGPRELYLSVADRGAGIAPGEQSKVFDKFYRIAGPARRASGTGMGLAIVKGLVEAHGGRVMVASAPGHGSTFTMVLPVDAPATHEEQPLPAGASESLPSRTSGEERR